MYVRCLAQTWSAQFDGRKVDDAGKVLTCSYIPSTCVSVSNSGERGFLKLLSFGLVFYYSIACDFPSLPPPPPLDLHCKCVHRP